MSANYGDVARNRKRNAIPGGDFAMKSHLAPFDRVRYECAAEVLCACCHEVLDRHQPMDRQPERLLGTCPRCSSWFLVDTDACVMYLLPDLADLAADE